MINYKLIVGSNLNQLRKQQNKSQAEVAKYLELTVAAYQNYEAGRREANYETLVKLADFYGVTTDFILGREPAPTPFADLDLSEDDEAEVIAKYMSLPPEIRACMLDVLVQLGEAAKKRQTKTQNIDVTYAKIYADEGGVIKKEVPADLPKISDFFDD